MNYQEVEKYLSFLNRYGVSKINIRIFGKEQPIKNKFYDTNDFESIKKMIENQQLQNQTINCTFNELKNFNIKAAKDSDIGCHNFLMIDIDPERPKGQSATEQEKANAESLMYEVKKYLDGYGVPVLLIDSGNGFHMLIPLEQEKNDIKKVTNLKKEFLKHLSEKFDTFESKIDLTVYNPSRLGKLVGCVASKGENTSDRPHRVSRIISSVDDVRGYLKISQLESMVENLTNESSKNKVVSQTKLNIEKKIKKVYVEDVNGWLTDHGLSYRIKNGDKEGIQFFIFDKCPFKEHTNNQNGSCLIKHPDNSLQFRCQHASHENLNIDSFIQKYPKPIKTESIIPEISLEGLKKGEKYSFDQYHLNINGLYLVGEETPLRISSCLFIDKVITNIETKKIKFSLTYIASGGAWETIELDGALLQQQYLKN